MCAVARGRPRTVAASMTSSNWTNDVTASAGQSACATSERSLRGAEEDDDVVWTPEASDPCLGPALLPDAEHLAGPPTTLVKPPRIPTDRTFRGQRRRLRGFGDERPRNRRATPATSTRRHGAQRPARHSTQPHRCAPAQEHEADDRPPACCGRPRVCGRLGCCPATPRALPDFSQGAVTPARGVWRRTVLRQAEQL